MAAGHPDLVRGTAVVLDDVEDGDVVRYRLTVERSDGPTPDDPGIAPTARRRGMWHACRLGASGYKPSEKLPSTILRLMYVCPMGQAWFFRFGVLRVVFRIAAATAVLAAIIPAAAARAAPRTGAAPGPPAGFIPWPMFHQDVQHHGVTTDPAIGAHNAASLAVAWEANTGGAAYASPAIVYSATLNKVVALVGSHAKTMNAYDVATGDRLWYYRTDGSITSSPAVLHDIVYVGSADHYLYAFDLASGALRCRVNTGGIIASSPVAFDTPAGPEVVFGDNGLSGFADGGSEWAINGNDCSIIWRFNGWDPLTGAWSSPALATDKNGRQLVVVGAGDPDDAVYAWDALTGAQVWRFQTEKAANDNDVGAGPTITDPGVNGFADGMAYINGKDQISYAIDLTTGEQVWSFRVRDDSPNASGTTRSTSAVVGDRIYFGYGSGVYALSAVDGQKIWKTTNAYNLETISSPALSGAAGDQVLFAADLSGNVLGLDPNSGVTLWSYKTGGFIYGSAAVAAGSVLIASSDGFLYAFGLGGRVTAPPQSTILAPADGSTLSNPAGGPLQLTGTATDDISVSQVLVAVRDRNTNRWWNATMSKWEPVIVENPATLANPGATSTNWSFAFPVGAAGSSFAAQADSRDSDGQRGPVVSSTKFVVSSLGNPPDTTVATPKNGQVFNLPVASGETMTIRASGTAGDTNNAHPGVAYVNVVVFNNAHQEYFCGFQGCAGPSPGESGEWTPVYTVVRAQIDNPGATLVNWTLDFVTFDHPHNYRLTAWAVDNDGESDATKSVVNPICVQGPGVKTCF